VQNCPRAGMMQLCDNSTSTGAERTQDAVFRPVYHLKSVILLRTYVTSTPDPLFVFSILSITYLFSSSAYQSGTRGI
jgi:hypothetical protein